MTAIARFAIRHRWLVIGFWAVMAVAGFALTPLAIDRLSQRFDIPGREAYEANLRILNTYGDGQYYPLVLVFQAPKVVENAGVRDAIAAAAAVNNGARVSSYWNTGHNPAYVSKDGNTTFALIYPKGVPTFTVNPAMAPTEAALAEATPPGVTSYLTGIDPVVNAAGEGAGGPGSLLVDVVIAGLLALAILLFVFGTLPAIATPLVVAAISISTTFMALLGLTYVTSVSAIVQFLVALIGLGIAIDYALLLVFRFREELAAGRPVNEAVIEANRRAGRAVVISGSTVAIGLLSLIAIPVPFIRSLGYGGMLIPAVSVVVAVTLLPAVFSVLGPRINSVRLLPRRLVLRGDGERGFWWGWSRYVIRHPVPIAIVGFAIVALLLVPGLQIHAADADVGDRPGAGPAIQGRDALARAGITAGIFKPLNVLIEGASGGGAASRVANEVADVAGVAGAAAPQGWSRGESAVVEAFTTGDASSDRAVTTIDNLRNGRLDALRASQPGLRLTLAGQAPQERDFIEAIYGNFFWVLAFVIAFTYVLLARAFRSLVLPLQAVALNLLSLGAAYGIVVFVFQWGNGAALFGVQATGAIIFWIPLMIFAFLYGISMDYEVFMLSRMREIYDRSGSTSEAVAGGLAATGKLVTSAALVLFFAFVVLGSQPGLEIKQFAMGLAAGLVFDATIIRALLVPALIRLIGQANWWMPKMIRRLLRVREEEPIPTKERAAA